MVEHTVAWRCARLVAGSDSLRATEDATTLCDEPVSTTKLRWGPLWKRTSTLSEMSPATGDTVSGTVVPSPCVSVVGGAPTGPV